MWSLNQERAINEIFSNGNTITPSGKLLPEYQGSTDFVNEGRAVINYSEYESFKDELEQKYNEELYLIAVTWDILLDRIIRESGKRCVKTLNGEIKSDLVYNQLTIKNIAEIHNMDTRMLDAGIIIATNDESHDFKNIVAHAIRLAERKGVATDDVEDSISSSDKEKPETHIMIFVDTHLVRRYFNNKTVTRPVARAKSTKRPALDDTFITEMKTEPKRNTQSYEIQLDVKMTTLKRKASELQKLNEEIAENNVKNQPHVLMALDDKTQEIQIICDRVDGLIISLQREASTHIDTLTRKIAMIETTRTEIEDMTIKQDYENGREVISLKDQIDNLSDQLESARNNGEEKQEIIENLEQERQQTEANLTSWKKTVQEFSLYRELEVKKLETLLEEKSNQLLTAKSDVEELRKMKVTTKIERDISMEIAQEGGCTPLRVIQSARKSDLSTKIKTSARSLPPIKLEMNESSDSDDDQYGTPATHMKKCHINTADIQNNDTAKVSSFTATPAKFGMRNWDPNDCGFMEHLVRLDMGLKQSEEKGCSLTTQQNLILMTLPSQYVYVNQYVDDSRDDMDTFKKKLVELIIGTNTDQTNQLMMTQRNVGEHVLSYFNRLQNLYCYCASKTTIEDDAWGIRIIYQKVMAAMSEASKMELQRIVEESIEKGSLKFSALQAAVVKAARKGGSPMSGYSTGNHINNVSTPTMMHQTQTFTPPTPMAPQTVPPYMINRYDNSNSNSRNRDGNQNRNREQPNNSYPSNNYRKDWKATIRCYYCGIIGHLASECRKRVKDRQESNSDKYETKNYGKGNNKAKGNRDAREHNDKAENKDGR